jgi:hypothetical protein
MNMIAARNERGHRTHRQIDAARDDHKTHTHRDDADEGRAGEHVQGVVRGGEVAVEQRAGYTQQHQADDRPEAVQALGPAGRSFAAVCGSVRLRRGSLQFRWHGR